VAFIGKMRVEGHAVESVCRVLRGQDCQIAARTYRAWTQPDRVVAARTISDAHVEHAVRGRPSRSATMAAVGSPRRACTGDAR